MVVVCTVCGGEFEAARRTARFCSSKCRVRAHRAKKDPAAAAPAVVVALKAAAAGGGEEPAAAGKPPAAGPGRVEASALAELEECGRVGTALGQAVLVLARRLDASERDTGAAVASLSKQLGDTMALAVAGAAQQGDTVDELRARRDAKLRGAG